MKSSKISRRNTLSLFVALILCLFIPQTVFCQAEKLGIVSYAPPKGWAKTPKENIIAFSEINQKTGGFCIITLYGATNGTESPASDFTREWKRLVLANLKVETNPSTETQIDDGWTMTAGASAAEMDGGKALAFLSVFSGYGKTVSVLGVFNEQSYLPKLEAFVGSVEMDKSTAPANNQPAANLPATLDSDGNLVIPELARELTLADLVGEWGDNPGRISTIYVDRSTGAYARTDSLHFTSTWKIEGDGKYTNDFFEVRNGKKLRDITTGTITINGRLITIKHKGTAKYVVRGWLELPNITVLKVAGPWFDDQEIPEKMFTDFSESSRFILTTKWVRKK